MNGYKRLSDLQNLKAPAYKNSDFSLETPSGNL